MAILNPTLTDMTLPARPDCILLATDLSARSDRAQARAVQLAQHWQARLVAMVALSDEPVFSHPNAFHEGDDDAPLPTPMELLEQKARRELADVGIPVDVVVAVGKPGPLAVKVATEHGCGLIVTGTSRSEAVIRMDPGSTLRWLARHAPVPVLAVNQRTHGAYQKITLASDYSDAAIQTLRLCDAWFGDASRRTLLHGYSIPLATLSLNDSTRDAALDVLQQQAEQQIQSHLAQVLGDAAVRWTTGTRAGGPVRLLREHARETGTDLTVITSHGRLALTDKLIGSVAERLLETVNTDLLIARPPKA